MHYLSENYTIIHQPLGVCNDFATFFSVNLLFITNILPKFAIITHETLKSTMYKDTFLIIKAAAIAAMASAISACSDNSAGAIIVTNDSPTDRADEIVELSPAPEILSDTASAYVIADAAGLPVTFQITHDGALIFPASVKADQSATYNIIKRTDLNEDLLKSSMAMTEASNIAYTVRPDCQDDFAWENEHSGYRLYGPSFKKGGGKVHGYDIWCKRGPAPIVNRFYNLDHGPEKITYHKDHGEGFDGYTVGPTLGAGANALMLDSAICYPTAYDSYELLDNGPLRLTVRFTVDSIPFGNDASGAQRYITETRTLSLDRLSHFNKVSTVYEGVDSPTPIVAGIVVHADKPDGYTLIPDADAISVIDLSDDTSVDNGEIYVGAIVPGADTLRYAAFDEVKANAVGQALASSTYTPGVPFVYYWGSGWSKGSVPDSARWQSIISARKQAIDAPLKATLKK